MPTVESATRTDTGLASELRMAVMRLRRRLAHERHPDNELNMGAMSALGCLYRRGELSIGELAAQELVQPPSMTRTVSSLEEAGLVVRRAHPTDGRQVLVSLTEGGERSVLADRRRRDEWLATRLRELTADERAALRKAAPILQRLASQE